MDVTVHGAAGEGAWVGDARLAVTSGKPLAETTGSAPSRVRRRVADLAEAGNVAVPGHLLQYRCTGREYMDMARGHLDFARYGRRLKPWDHAAGVLLHGEAGDTAPSTSRDGPTVRPGASWRDLSWWPPTRPCGNPWPAC